MKSLLIDCHCLYSQSQAVILEVLGVGGGVVRQGGVRDELKIASSIPYVSVSHTITYCTIRVSPEVNSILFVFLVFPPVEELKDGITFEWPLQLVIIFPLHETSKD